VLLTKTSTSRNSFSTRRPAHPASFCCAAQRIPIRRSKPGFAPCSNRDGGPGNRALCWSLPNTAPVAAAAVETVAKPEPPPTETPMPDSFQYDVFLSHNQADKPRCGGWRTAAARGGTTSISQSEFGFGFPPEAALSPAPPGSDLLGLACGPQPLAKAEGSTVGRATMPFRDPGQRRSPLQPAPAGRGCPQVRSPLLILAVETSANRPRHEVLRIRGTFRDRTGSGRSCAVHRHPQCARLCGAAEYGVQVIRAHGFCGCSRVYHECDSNRVAGAGASARRQLASSSPCRSTA